MTEQPAPSHAGQAPGHPPHTADAADHERRATIASQRAIWVDGVLPHSLWSAALGVLGLAERHEAPPRPYHLAERTPGAADRLLPPDVRLVEQLDQHHGALLIVGAPGSGKTTLLLELLRDLLDRADADPTRPIPVKCDLASWDRTGWEGLPAGRREEMREWSLVSWVSEQLHRQGSLPVEAARQLAQQGAILPLLDGLDEIPPERRTACAEAIRAYLERGDRRQLVVTCTEQEYATLAELVQPHRAVVAQPLSDAQVDGYLQGAGARLAGLRRLLEAHPALRVADGSGGPPLATPLGLALLILGYADLPAVELPEATPDQLREGALNRWVERALMPNDQRAARGGAEVSARLRWLRWLAWQLRRTGRSTFRIDEMQPDWLVSSEADLRLYIRIIVLGDWLEDVPGRPLLFGLTFSGVLGLLLGWSVGIVGLLAGLVMGFAQGMAHNLDGGPGLWSGPWIRLGAHPAAGPRRFEPNAGLRPALWGGLVVGAGCGLIAGLCAALLAGPGSGIAVGLLAGLLVGLICLFPNVVSHVVLRLVLARRGAAPLDIAGFCDRCAERGLLRRVGDGWQLAHPLLLEQLATRHAATLPHSLRGGWPSPYHLLMNYLLQRAAPEPPAAPRGDGPV